MQPKNNELTLDSIVYQATMRISVLERDVEELKVSYKEVSKILYDKIEVLNKDINKKSEAILKWMIGGLVTFSAAFIMNVVMFILNKV